MSFIHNQFIIWVQENKMNLQLSHLKKYIKQIPILYWALSPIIYFRKGLLSLSEILFSYIYSYLFSIVTKGSLVVHLNDFMGDFEIDFRSHILKTILKNKFYEPKLVKIINRYIDVNKDTIDVGANIGLYTVFFSKLISEGKRVLSIEPSPEALTYLKHNIQSNKCANIIIFEGVAVNRKQDQQLRFIPGMSEYSSTKMILHQATKDKQLEQFELESVAGETIDNLVETFGLSPGFIKVDVEGGEYSVLSGAISTIRKYKPIILLEVSNDLLKGHGATSQKIEQILLNSNYIIFDAEDNGIPIKHPFDGEFLAIPSEKINSSLSI